MGESLLCAVRGATDALYAWTENGQTFEVGFSASASRLAGAQSLGARTAITGLGDGSRSRSRLTWTGRRAEECRRQSQLPSITIVYAPRVRWGVLGAFRFACGASERPSSAPRSSARHAAHYSLPLAEAGVAPRHTEPGSHSRRTRHRGLACPLLVSNLSPAACEAGARGRGVKDTWWNCFSLAVDGVGVSPTAGVMSARTRARQLAVHGVRRGWPNVAVCKALHPVRHAVAILGQLLMTRPTRPVVGFPGPLAWHPGRREDSGDVSAFAEWS